MMYGRLGKIRRRFEYNEKRFRARNMSNRTARIKCKKEVFVRTVCWVGRLALSVEESFRARGMSNSDSSR